ncbi:hypothetical protein HOY82DRAFT_537714 [Tuber indicum]|nr:hypothetical protein HOY82DRAFT_537714 [Tuber indicum]
MSVPQVDFYSNSQSLPSGIQPTSSINHYLMKGLEEVEHQQYQNISSFSAIIKSKIDQFQAGSINTCPEQYVVFTLVTQQQLANIEQICNINYKGLRLTYLYDIQILIVKIMLSAIHELTSEEFTLCFWEKIMKMGLKKDLAAIRVTTFHGISSSKEADAAFKPQSRSLITDWPTIVFECGVSEFYNHLKADAH